MIGIYVLAAIVVLALIFVKKTIVIIPQSETKIIERLGRYYATLRPGTTTRLQSTSTNTIIPAGLINVGCLSHQVKS